jgi:hypothetical protein
LRMAGATCDHRYSDDFFISLIFKNQLAKKRTLFKPDY